MILTVMFKCAFYKKIIPYMFMSIIITIPVTAHLAFRSVHPYIDIYSFVFYRYSNCNHTSHLNNTYMYALTYWQYSGNFYTAFMTKKSWNWSLLHRSFSHILIFPLTATVISQSTTFAQFSFLPIQFLISFVR